MRLRRITTVLAAACTLFGGVVVAPAAQAHTPGSLRVASFNIHAGIGSDGKLNLAHTADVISASRADVVGLQEVDVHWGARSAYVDQSEELAARTGMHPFFAPIYDLPPEVGHGQRRQFGVLILSKFPIQRGHNHWMTRLPTTEPNPVPAPAPGFGEVVVSVQGKPIHVYTTHLDYQPDPRVRQIQVDETVRILDQDGPHARQVLVGDFNVGPEAPELTPLLARLSDTWAATRGRTGGLTYPAEAPNKRIDYVTTSARLRPETARVPDSRASDHRPVISDVGLRSR